MFSLIFTRFLNVWLIASLASLAMHLEMELSINESLGCRITLEQKWRNTKQQKTGFQSLSNRKITFFLITIKIFPCQYTIKRATSLIMNANAYVYESVNGRVKCILFVVGDKPTHMFVVFCYLAGKLFQEPSYFYRKSLYQIVILIWIFAFSLIKPSFWLVQNINSWTRFVCIIGSFSSKCEGPPRMQKSKLRVFKRPLMLANGTARYSTPTH